MFPGPWIRIETIAGKADDGAATAPKELRLDTGPGLPHLPWDELPKEDNMEEKVLKAMQDAGKPVRPGDIAKALDMDSKEVSKAIDALKKQGKVVSPKRCFYSPA